jgi:hypothetical protein
MAFYDFPLKPIEKRWIQQGGQLWQLIEPVGNIHSIDSNILLD